MQAPDEEEAAGPPTQPQCTCPFALSARKSHVDDLPCASYLFWWNIPPDLLLPA